MVLKNYLLLPVISLLLFPGNIFSNKDDTPPYKNPSLSIDERVEDLLKRMTLEEKIDILGGTGFATKPIERLGIPELRMTDGPLGVRWNKTTAFPSGIMVASTWNPELAYKVGSAIGREVKARDRHVILGPCVNIARIPQGGRNFESYGEDPFLASRMTVDYIKGVQSEGVAATVKHFACNNQELERMYVDTKVDERTLNEIYLPAFKAAVQESDVLCVMNAYNKINGHYASENDYLLIDKLKKEWGFNWLVMSDWGAVHSSIPTANGGMDLEMPTGEYLNKETLLSAVKSGVVKESTIDDKVRRILRVLFKLGLFEKPSLKDESLLGTKENLDAAYKTALEGIILLQNKDNILPLDFYKIKSVAVVGPNAHIARTGGGGSSMVDPINVSSPLQILKEKFGEKVKINYGAGVKLDGESNPIESKYFSFNGEQGLKGEYFDNKNLSGTPAFARVDKQVNFDWGGEGPKENFQTENFSVRWTGKLKAEETGEYILDVTSDDGIRLYFDGSLVIDYWTDHAAESRTYKQKLVAGKEYDIKIEYYENGGSASCKFGWTPPGEDPKFAAIDAAKKSDVVLFFAGTSNYIESEGFDRQDLVMSKDQDKLIKELAAVNKNIVVVINSGSPVILENWLDDVKGIVQVWFGGSEMSKATMDVLSGVYNPSGKLPISYPKRWEDCSAYKLYKAQDSVTVYSDGIYVGYRHFEKNNIEPRYPFGYGLSYTSFKYSNLNLEKLNGSSVKVTFDLTNSGKVEGAEAAQLYVKEINPKIDRPKKELKGFKKLNLKPGETKQVEIILNKDSFSYWNPETKNWAMDSGDFEILVGSSSKDIKLKEKVNL